VPIYEGYAIPHAIIEIPICGRDLTKHMHNLMVQSFPGMFNESSTMLETCKKIKEDYGQVALDYDAELKSIQENNSSKMVE